MTAVTGINHDLANFQAKGTDQRTVAGRRGPRFPDLKIGGVGGSP